LEEKEIKKQFCGYCPVDKCLLDCEICNPKENSGDDGFKNPSMNSFNINDDVKHKE